MSAGPASDGTAASTRCSRGHLDFSKQNPVSRAMNMGPCWRRTRCSGAAPKAGLASPGDGPSASRLVHLAEGRQRRSCARSTIASSLSLPARGTPQACLPPSKGRRPHHPRADDAMRTAFGQSPGGSRGVDHRAFLGPAPFIGFGVIPPEAWNTSTELANEFVLLSASRQSTSSRSTTRGTCWLGQRARKGWA